MTILENTLQLSWSVFFVDESKESPHRLDEGQNGIISFNTLRFRCFFVCLIAMLHGAKIILQIVCYCLQDYTVWTCGWTHSENQFEPADCLKDWIYSRTRPPTSYWKHGAMLVDSFEAAVQVQHAFACAERLQSLRGGADWDMRAWMLTGPRCRYFFNCRRYECMCAFMFACMDICGCL